MKGKPVVPRSIAEQEVDEAITHYLVEAGSPQAALGFVDALEEAYKHIGLFPSTGSSRYAHELNLPSLRSWKLSRYPYLVFYVEQHDCIDVWRVLQNQRDIPAWMLDDSDREPN